MSSRPPASASGGAWRGLATGLGRTPVAAGLLALLVLAAHGGSLDDGLFFDDHWHRTTIRESGWSFLDLIEAATFDLPGQLVHLWWQEQPLRWRYARPLAMLAMKIEYLLAGGEPVIIHAFALGWHWLAALGVLALARWALRSPGWGLLAAALFVIHPHSVFTVSWIAARNALICTPLFVLAVWLYIRASRPEARLAGRASPSRAPSPSDTGRIRLAPLAGSLALAALALFSRETAIIFPLVVLLADLLGGGVSHVRRRLPVHGLIAGLTVVYLYWRLVVFPNTAVPDIYFTTPSGLAYLPWAASKLLHMVFSLILYTPMFLGLATYGDFSPEEATAHVVMVVLLVLVAVWYARASREVRLRWLWPTWVVVAFVPVIPVFTMPHFAHLPAAPLAVMTAACLRLARGWTRVLVLALVVLGTAYSFVTYRYVWRGVVRSEQLIYADMHFNTSRPPAGAKLFLVNVPVAGIYAAVAMREAWERPDLEAHVLTFSPHPLAMLERGTVEALNDHELLVSAPPPGYFTGMSGRMLIEGLRPGRPLRQGDVIPGELFDTSIVEADARGATKLRFTFRKPLSSPEYRFYVSSWVRPAWWRQFDRRPEPLSPEAAELFARARHADETVRREARRHLHNWALVLLMQDASPLLRDAELLDEHVTDEEVQRLEEWCRSEGGVALLKERAAWRTVSKRWKRERNIYFGLQRIAARYIRSDLMLTGD